MPLTPEQLTTLTEALAALAHRQWAGWMASLFAQSPMQRDESVVLPRDLARRWKRQQRQPYAFLPPEAQEAARVEAAKVLAVLATEGLTLSHGSPPVATDWGC